MYNRNVFCLRQGSFSTGFAEFFLSPISLAWQWNLELAAYLLRHLHEKEETRFAATFYMERVEKSVLDAEAFAIPENSCDSAHDGRRSGINL
jgi:hypothetical protein